MKKPRSPAKRDLQFRPGAGPHTDRPPRTRAKQAEHRKLLEELIP